jgi:thioredoxin-like negative regulator of GroEL
MKYLMTQEELEQLIGLQPATEPLPDLTVVYFTATWCGPCRALNTAHLEEALPEINWLKCDVDQNNYSPGYCGVRSIPTFITIYKKKIVNTFTSSNTENVELTLRNLINKLASE